MDDPARFLTEANSQSVCDFCHCTAVRWRYPARSFIALPPIGTIPASQSVQDWAACDPCHDAIEAGLARMLAVCLERQKQFAPSIFGTETEKQMPAWLLRALMDDLWQKFLQARTGPAVLLDESAPGVDAWPGLSDAHN